MDDVTTVAGAATGPAEDSAPAPAPAAPGRQPGPSLRPALVVVATAVAILALFGVGSALWGSGPGPRAHPPTAIRVPGTSLVAVAAASDLTPIVAPGSPPANIVDALTVPRGAVSGAPADHSADSAQYDKAMHFTVAASEQAMIVFYRSELPRLGWHVSSTGPPKGAAGVEVLAERPGTDGWQWEVGAVISPTTFAGSPTGSTAFELRLFQVPDGN